MLRFRPSARGAPAARAATAHPGRLAASVVGRCCAGPAMPCGLAGRSLGVVPAPALMPPGLALPSEVGLLPGRRGRSIARPTVLRPGICA